MNNLLIITLILQIVHLLYHQVTTNFDFYPFNNIRQYTKKQILIESLANAVTMGFPIVSFLLFNPVMMQISLVIYGLLLIGEFFQWWVHYLFKPSPGWVTIYNVIFAPTIKILPPIKNNPVPNLEHMILHILTILCFIFTLVFLIAA